MFEYLSQVQKIIAMCGGDYTEIVICNKEGYVEYGKFQKYLKHSSSMIGKHILEFYPSLNEETSTIIQTLRTGDPVVDQKQLLTTKDGYKILLIATSMPIYEKGELIGVIDYSKWLDINPSESSSELYQLSDIMTQNKEMLLVKEQVKRIADNDSTVLIYGETGTGKELVAQSIHTSSRRIKKPFISQNCAAIPSNLFESIFFGTEKGSFTGATTQKGLFEIADGGTLFLDEINSMDLSMQVKLLKVLEEKKVRHIGGHKDIFFDVRIICATNERLEDLIKAKRFREDLYYRISIVKTFIPPLRDRKEDILFLTDFFIQKYNKRMNRNIRGVSKIVEGAFEKWDWPGNVRELKNVIESAFNTEEGDTIILKDVHDLINPGEYKNEKSENVFDFEFKNIIDLQSVIDNYEKDLIVQAIKNSGSLAEAAKKLKLSPQTLNYKISKHHLR